MPLFLWVDEFLNRFLVSALPLCLWGGIAGVLSMTVYALVSPQQKLADIKIKCKAAQRELAAYDGEFEGVKPLAAKAIGYPALQLLYTLGPIAAAAIPVVLMILWVAPVYNTTQCIPFGPAWVRSWEFLFFASVCTASLTVKAVRGIH